MDRGWIEQMSDDECVEVLRLYAESAEELVSRHGAPLIAAAVRYALRAVAAAPDFGQGSARADP